MPTKPILLATLTILILSAFYIQPDFITDQKKYQRVRTAFAEKGEKVTEKLNAFSIQTNNLNLLLVAYKAEQELVVYGKVESATTYKKIHTYAICASSGDLGPKRKQGDLQVPEGFYHIDRFNPASSYYLSLGINYPNNADRIKGEGNNLGGDIFIHGECVTIGCLPMTNDKIKEIYLYAIMAKNNGQSKIPVYVFPFKMTDQQMEVATVKYSTRPKLMSFWKNLQMGYQQFHSNLKPLDFSINAKGDYQFN